MRKYSSILLLNPELMYPTKGKQFQPIAIIVMEEGREGGGMLLLSNSVLFTKLLSLDHFPEKLSLPPSVLKGAQVATLSLWPCLQSSDCDRPGPLRSLRRRFRSMWDVPPKKPHLFKLPDYHLFRRTKKLRGQDWHIKEKVSLLLLDVCQVQPQMSLFGHHRHH